MSRRVYKNVTLRIGDGEPLSVRDVNFRATTPARPAPTLKPCGAECSVEIPAGPRAQKIADSIREVIARAASMLEENIEMMIGAYAVFHGGLPEFGITRRDDPDGTIRVWCHTGARCVPVSPSLAPRALAAFHRWHSRFDDLDPGHAEVVFTPAYGETIGHIVIVHKPVAWKSSN